MKGKQLAVLLVVVLVLGGLWLLLGGPGGKPWSETGGDGVKVVDFPLNDVAQIVIQNSAGDLHLVKKADVWTVQERAGYPASFEEVSDFLRKLWELKRTQIIKVGPSQLPRLELVEPGKGDKAGTLVQLLGADDKPLNSVILGKKYLRKSEGGGDESEFGGPGAGGYPAGRYVKRTAGETVSLVSQTFDDAEPKPERWLSKDFVKIEGPKSIAVAGPTDAQHWTVNRENATAEWTLAGLTPDEKLDSTKTSALGTVFAAPNFSDVQVPGTKLEEPVTSAVIDTFDGFRYELKIGKAVVDNYPVVVNVSASFPKERVPGKDEKPEDKTRLDNEFTSKQKASEEKLAKEKEFEGRPFLVAKYLVDPLLKDRGSLLAPKPTPAPSPEPAKAQVTPAPAAPAPAAVVPAPVAPIIATPTPVPSLPVPAASVAPVTVTTPPMTAPTPAAEAVPPVVPAPTAPAASPEPVSPSMTPAPQSPTPAPAPANSVPPAEPRASPAIQ